MSDRKDKINGGDRTQKTMNDIPKEQILLAEKIAEAESRLERLDKAIQEVGMPAGAELRRRLEALKVEDRALRRNFEESKLRGEPSAVRMAKIEALLQHIEEEELSVENDANFLHQAAPTSMELAVQAGAHMVDLYRRGVKRVIGDKHPLGESVFVNHTHENLTDQHGLPPEEK